jgi:hypothetical protein
MINTSAETVFPLIEGPDHCMRRRGRKLHPSTFYRWKEQGLETILVGGIRCTSQQALQRFFERRTAERDRTSDVPSPIGRSAARRLRDSERAAAELESGGA